MIKLYGQVVPKRLFGSVSVESKAHNGKFQAKVAEPSTEDRTIVADSGYDALSLVTVKAATLQEKTVSPSSMEQTVTPDVGVYGLSKVIVAAQGNSGLLQDKTVELLLADVVVTPDEGYYGLSSVTVKCIPDTTALDFSDYSVGSFEETLSDGSTLTHTVEFDSDGVPVSVDDMEVKGISVDVTGV